MNRLTSIVVGIDFSACSAAALAQAVRIAAWNRSTLKVLHVAEPMVDAMPDPMFLPVPVLDLGIDPAQLARDAWPTFAPDVPGRKDLKLDVIVGGPLSEMTHAVRTAHAELLVIGVHGSLPRERGVGLFASGCVRRAGTKVLLVRQVQKGPFKSVVACVDFSPTSLEAVAAASRLAAQDGSALHVLHVYRAPWLRLHPKTPDPLASPEFHGQYREAMVKHLAEFVKPLEHQMTYLKPKFEAVSGESHGHGIAEYAASAGADLVVLGTRGKTNLHDLVLGSTAERVLREAPCCVLAVPPQAA